MKKLFLFNASEEGQEGILMNNTWKQLVNESKIFESAVKHSHGRGNINDAIDVPVFMASGIIHASDIAQLKALVMEFLAKYEIDPKNASLKVMDALNVSLTA